MMLPKKKDTPGIVQGILSTVIVLLLFLLSFANATGNAKSKPKLAIFNLVNSNIPERHYNTINRKIRIRMVQSNYFNVIPHESIVNLLASNNRTLDPVCYKNACLVQTARDLSGIDYLLTGRIDNDNRNVFLKLKLFSIKHNQTAFESTVKTSYSDSALGVIVQESMEKFHQDLRTNIYHTGRVVTSKPESNKGQLLLATGLLAATGVAIAWRDGQLNGSDDNDSDIEGIRSHPGTLSSLRGFFAIPSIGAAYKGQGGAGVASVNDGVSPMLNPAGLAGLEREWVNYSFTSLPTGVPSFFLGYAAPFSSNFYQGLAVRSDGDELANEITLYASFASNIGAYFRSIHNLKVGLGLKGYLLSVGEGGTGIDRSTGHGFGFGADVGLQFPLTDKITAGLILRDVYSSVTNTNTLTNREYDEPLPMELTVGFAYRVTGNFSLAIDGEKALVKDQVDHVRLGGSRTIFDILHLRLGTSQIINKENSRYISFGFGFDGDVENYSMHINYSFEKGLDNRATLSNQHQFSMDIGF